MPLRIALQPAEERALQSVADLESGGATPAEVAADWIRERLGSLPDLYAEAAARPHGTDPRERLRQRYRPDDVEVLFVGESAPAGGTFFYQADSHLFRAIRDACARAYGVVPEGDAFLDWFRDRHFWLVDIAQRPVNRLRGRPRKDQVDEGALPLARTIRDVAPDYVVAMKESIAPAVASAVELARVPGMGLLVLPFPLYKWRARFVDELSAFLAPAAEQMKLGGREATKDSTTAAGSAPNLTLHEAMLAALGEPGRTMTARELANAIAKAGAYRRGDGLSAPASQVSARARRYPRLFAIGPGGIRRV